METIKSIVRMEQRPD